MPAILRPEKDGYEYIGPCYIDGIMFGEALEGEGVEWSEIILY
jgi:hypothetical protein